MVMYCEICGAKIENGDEIDECPECLCNIVGYKSTIPDSGWIKAISSDESFFKAMEDLYKKDPIEFQLKITQFKNEINKRDQIEKQNQPQQSERITCPKCGSSNVTEGTKGFSLMTGFIGSGNFRYVCKKCGNKWKP